MGTAQAAAKKRAVKRRSAARVSDQSFQTYVSPAPELFQTLKNGDVVGLTRFMESPGVAIAEGITGLIRSEGLIAGAGAIAGRLVQGCLQGRLYQQFGLEIEELRARGKIAPDPATKPCGWESWRELLDAIDQDPIDEEKFRALKAMFYDINRVTSNDRDCILSYQLMKLARTLNAGELLLLKAIDAINQNGGRSSEAHWERWPTWAARVNQAYGSGPVSLIRLNEKRLVECELISSRNANDVTAVAAEDNRLTDLGLRFCKNIQQYQRVKEEVDQE
jgi:hypothetical protein